MLAQRRRTRKPNVTQQAYISNAYPCDEEPTTQYTNIFENHVSSVVDDDGDSSCSTAQPWNNNSTDSYVRAVSPWNEYSGRFDTGNSKFEQSLIRVPLSLHPPKKLKSKRSYWHTPTEHLTDVLSRVSPGATYENPRRNRRKRVQFQRLSLQRILSDYLEHVGIFLKHREGQKLSKPILEHQFGKTINRVFDDASLQTLAQRGYTVKDVVGWAWILETEDPYRAVLRFFELVDSANSQTSGRVNSVPQFVPLLLLRRKYLSIRAFRLLLMYSVLLLNTRTTPKLMSLLSLDLDSIEEVQESQTKQSHEPGLELASVIPWIKCLLHHAGQVWPPGQLVVARAVARYLTQKAPSHGVGMLAQYSIDKKRTHCFNKTVQLLSTPCKSHPFLSRSIQQQAQLELLKSMALHRPALAVNRPAYQAIIAVQLGHKKTTEEREFADLKSPSWPPWKEARLGIDDERGNEGIQSRTVKVLSQMTEAGYAHSAWEEIAKILAGWNSDGTPTIQTRTLSKPRKHTSRTAESHIWAARIRATRTVREAWSCFLSHQNQGLQPHETTYFAMAEKLVYAQRTFEKSSSEISVALPGDGVEVFPEPSSARDMVYVPIEPASLDDFLQQMVSRGIKPSIRFLILLLKFAPTLQWGLNWIRRSGMPDQVIDVLCCIPSTWSQAGEIRRTFDKYVPDNLFYAYLDFACRFCKANDQSLHLEHTSASVLFPIILGNLGRSQYMSGNLMLGFGQVDGQHENGPKLLIHIILLLFHLRTKQPYAWHVLLKSLSSPRIGAHRRFRRTVERILCWHEVIEALNWMNKIYVDPGMDGFMTACVAFSHAVQAGIRDETASDEALQHIKHAAHRHGIIPSHISNDFETMTRNGLNLLKGYFDRLVHTNSPVPITTIETGWSENRGSPDGKHQNSIHSVLQVPTPAMLHRFIRALGIAEDYEGLLSLLRWMSKHSSAIQEVADEHLNGERLMRRALVAVRVFLEGAWGDKGLMNLSRAYREPLRPPKTTEHVDAFEPNHDQTVPNLDDGLVKDAYRIIEATVLWGGWPTDEEVETYVKAGTELEE